MYDAAGNLLRKGVRDFTYDRDNRITDSNFTYDSNGNLTCDGVYLYTYNAQNQITEVKRVSDNSMVATYTYNYNGSRRSKTVYTGGTSQTTNFNWDIFGNLIRESGNTCFYFYDNKGNLIGMKKNNTNYIYHRNLRGDIVSITDLNCTIQAQYNYDPWGSQISYSGTLSQPFRYAGYYFDEETGLYYLKNRYYSPALGRFLTKDGYEFVDYADPQTLNLYAYCGNDPVSRTDPSGNGYVYNRFGERIGTTPGNDYTDYSQTATDTHGGGTIANTPRTGGGISGSAKNSGSSSSKSSGEIAFIFDFSKIRDSQGDSGLKDISDDEISRKARDKSLSGSERRRYQKEEKYRGLRNKQKRQNFYYDEDSIPLYFPIMPSAPVVPGFFEFVPCFI